MIDYDSFSHCHLTDIFFHYFRGSKRVKNQIIPQLQQLTNLNDFYFQQDGAPPHYSRGIREYLDEKFSSAWIGRRGPIDC